MKKVIYLIMFGIFLAIPINVSAEVYYSCEVANLTKLQKLAANIVNSYDYQETFNNNSIYGSVSFNLKLTNLTEKLYLINTETNTRYNYTSSEIVIPNISPGQTLHYAVYANDYGCNDRYLMTIYINIPYYNKYYTDELCKNFQGYKLCSKWANVQMTYEDFKNVVSNYNIDEVIEVIEEEDIKTFNDIFIEVVDYLDRNKMPIFGSTIIITSTLIIILQIINNKNRLNLK